MYTIQEIARRGGVRERAVWRWVSEGKITTRRVEGDNIRVYVDEAEADEFLQRRMSQIMEREEKANLQPLYVPRWKWEAEQEELEGLREDYAVALALIAKLRSEAGGSAVQSASTMPTYSTPAPVPTLTAPVRAYDPATDPMPPLNVRPVARQPIEARARMVYDVDPEEERGAYVPPGDTSRRTAVSTPYGAPTMPTQAAPAPVRTSTYDPTIDPTSTPYVDPDVYAGVWDEDM